MDSLYLVAEIKNFLEDSTENLLLDSPKSGKTKLNLFEYFLPEKTKEQDEYPFVVVQPGGDEEDVSSNEYSVKLKLVLGVFNENDKGQGMKYLTILSNTIRTKLKEKQIFGSFSLSGKVKFIPFDEQLSPYYHGLIEIEFDGPGISIERRDYGEHF